VVGIVTDRDLALEVLGRPGQPSDLKIGNLAKSPPLAVASNAGVREAVQAMAQAGVRRLLVVDEDGGVVGLVSSDDLLCAVSEELEGLARALRTNIQHEKSERKVVTVAAGRRAVFPSFGTAAAQ
jgi:signal-transduction protein with cAMP-binding, CBS, and nucleotidyltransferase domain